MSVLNRFPLISALLLGIAFISPAQSASPCKSLPQSTCVAKTSCTWVQGYTRKDGARIKAYCRALPKKKVSTIKGQQTGETIKHQPPQPTPK
jgi:hypothetical protein